MNDTSARGRSYYRVGWTDAAAAEKAAKANGYTGQDGQSYWDCTDIDTHHRTRDFRTFREARRFAKRLVAQGVDIFGEAFVDCYDVPPDTRPCDPDWEYPESTKSWRFE